MKPDRTSGVRYPPSATWLDAAEKPLANGLLLLTLIPTLKDLSIPEDYILSHNNEAMMLSDSGYSSQDSDPQIIPLGNFHSFGEIKHSEHAAC